MKTLFSFLFILFVFVFSSVAQQIAVPIDAVKKHVKVFELPDSDSPVVCELHPGDLAVLITDTVSKFYYILCENQEAGYASKRWTKILGWPTASGAKDDLVIGSWNIKWFGFYLEDKHDYEAMADIVQEFDVMAVQELRGERYEDRLNALLAELTQRGLNYDYIFSDSTGYSNNPDTTKKDYIEHYAFFWDTDRVELATPDNPWEFISTPAINNPDFRQVPMVTEFVVKSDSGFDFMIATVHTVYSKGINEVRESEIQFLHDWMNEQANDLNADEKDIFIIGDFNASPPSQPSHFDKIITDTTMYRVVFKEPLNDGEDSKRTTILVKDEIDPEDHLLPAYDHLLMTKHTTYAFDIYPITWSSGYIGVVEFDQDSKWDGMKRYEVARAMSDHRPIWIKLDYDTEDRD